MPEFAFTVPGKAVAKGRPRFARRGNFVSTFTPKKTESAEGVVRHIASQAWNSNPLARDIAIELRIVVFLPVPTSMSKAKRAAALAGTLRPTTRPDVDNYLKLQKDALSSVLWVDDAQVWRAELSKLYSEAPRTEISMTWEA